MTGTVPVIDEDDDNQNRNTVAGATTPRLQNRLLNKINNMRQYMMDSIIIQEPEL